MLPFATIEDLNNLWRPLKTDEISKAEKLLEVASDTLRAKAQYVGKDLDNMLLLTPNLANVAKSVVVDIVARYLNTPTNKEPMSQMSESALGYSFSGTYLVPGGGLYIKKEELARLGLKRARYGVIDFYD